MVLADSFDLNGINYENISNESDYTEVNIVGISDEIMMLILCSVNKTITFNQYFRWNDTNYKVVTHENGNFEKYLSEMGITILLKINPDEFAEQNVFID